MSDERKWAWMYPDDEQCQGPFDTREQAVADAQRAVNEVAADQREGGYEHTPMKVILGRCKFARATDYIHDIVNIDWLMETLDDAACSDEFGFWEDELFEVKCVPGCGEKHKCGPAAEDSLKQLLTTWAEEHLTSKVWTMYEEVETIELTGVAGLRETLPEPESTEPPDPTEAVTPVDTPLPLRKGAKL